MVIEVLNPVEAYYVCSLAIIGYCNALGSRKIAFSILVGKVVLYG